MSELDTIESALERAASRRRWERAWQGLWRGLVIGGALWLVVLAVYKLAPIPRSILVGAAVVATVSVLAGFLSGWLRKPSLRQTARWLDGHNQLEERLSTALELADSKANENWRALLMTDAARVASQIDLRKLVPIILPRASRWALLILALSAGLGFIPEYRTQTFLQKKRDAEVVKAAGQKLVELTRQNLEHRSPAFDPTRKSLESVEQAGLQLERGQLSRTEALKDLASVTDALKSEMKNLKSPALQALERAAKQSSRGNGMGTADNDLQKKIEDLQKSLGKAADPQKLEELKKELRNTQKAAADMPNDNSPASAQARQQMRQNLSNLAREAKDMGQEMPNLDNAIAALEANQTDNLIRDLDAATTDLDKLKEMTKNLQQLQQQEKEGRDLPEQLKLGQADMARQSLQRMIDQLKSTNLPPGQLEKMMDELSRSIDPASPYGKAAEYLRQSTKQLKSNNKSDATKSMASAANELQKALDQMQDAQAIAESLDALKKAEMAIARRGEWGTRPGSGKNLGTGNGGKGGKGVGTWADENNTFYPEITERWDNSGLERPDMDPRGQTDRGDQQLSDNLAPTKLHGQVTPGGPMPSITLKGVNIKGQSSVDYQEAATAAQSAAQSALNQDQVPRAYQNTVRDYFDDLKK